MRRNALKLREWKNGTLQRELLMYFLYVLHVRRVSVTRVCARNVYEERRLDVRVVHRSIRFSSQYLVNAINDANS